MRLKEMEQKQSRFKLLLGNLFAYGSMQVIMKIIPLIMLPIVTRLLTNTADFGRYDMFNTVVEFGAGLSLLGLQDAMFREYFEREDPLYRRGVTSTTLGLVLLGCAVVISLIVALRRQVSILFLGTPDGVDMILLAAGGALLQAIYNIVSQPTRMENRRGVYIVSGAANSILYYLFAILLLRAGKGYYSLIFGMLTTLLLLTIYFAVANRKNFCLRACNGGIARELLRIGLPLLPNFIIFWVFHSMDKIMITQMLGLEQVGIYSTGAKVAQVGQILYLAFSNGWQYFAFSTMHDEDQTQMVSRIFECLGLLSFVAVMLASCVDRWVFALAFTGDYVLGYTVFPYLLLSPLLLMLIQAAGNQLLVIKKTAYMPICLGIGALLNLPMNYFGIRYLGISGAAIATLAGYTISVILIAAVAKRKGLLTVRPKMIVAAGVCAAVMVLRLLSTQTVSTIAALAGVIICGLLYQRECRDLIKKLKDKE